MMTAVPWAKKETPASRSKLAFASASITPCSKLGGVVEALATPSRPVSSS